MAAGDGNKDVRAEYFDGKAFCCSGVECTAQAAVGRVLEQCDNEPRNVVQQGALQGRMMWCSDRCVLQGAESELRVICRISESKLCGRSTRTQWQQAILSPAVELRRLSRACAAGARATADGGAGAANTGLQPRNADGDDSAQQHQAHCPTVDAAVNQPASEHTRAREQPECSAARWSCGACTFQNDEANTVCEMCEQPRYPPLTNIHG